MDKRFFWRMQSLKKRIIFITKKLLYKVTDIKWTINRSSPLFFAVAIDALKLLLINGLITFLLYKVDGILINKYQLTINENAFFSFLLSGLSVTGIILGLYCSNIVSIYSTVYVNAPLQVSRLFQRDAVMNKSITKIISYIILDLILLAEHIFAIQQSLCSLLFLFLYIVYVIVFYWKTRDRAFQLSNSYSVSLQIQADLFKEITRASKRTLFSRDNNFQAHYQKQAEKNLDTLKTLARFNLENPKNRNSSMLEFMRTNLALLDAYWDEKNAIPYDSYWYKEKPIYKQWHTANDSEIELALNTGTSVSHSSEKDCFWFEEALLSVNNICFDKLCSSQDYQAIYEYLLFFANLQKKAVPADAAQFSLEKVFSLQQRVVSFFKNAAEKAKESNDTTLLLQGIIEVIVSNYTGLVLGINAHLNQIDIPCILKASTESFDRSEIDYKAKPYLNNSAIDRLFKCICAELEIEKKKITPDWHIHQVVAEILYNQIVGIILVLNRIINKIIPELGKSLQEDKLYTEAMIVFSKLQELLSKESIGHNVIDALLPQLISLHKEPNVIWTEDKYDIYQKNTHETVLKLPKAWLDCSANHTFEHWKSREDYPDLLGFCYNNYCEYLVSAIGRNDYEKFHAAYPSFLGVMTLYQEYIREDLLRIKEKHRQNIVFHVWTAPFLEYALISGLAIIWGEFTENTAWREDVRNAIDLFSQNDADRATDLFMKWSELIVARRHDILGIGNRDVLQTGWEMRIANAIESTFDPQFDIADYGYITIKTNSKLLKAFLGTFSMGLHIDHAEDVFFIDCLNNYIPPEKKFQSSTGWERKLSDEQ